MQMGGSQLKMKAKRNWHSLIVVLLDVLIVFVSGLFAFLIRFDFSFNAIDQTYFHRWLYLLPIEILVIIAVFFALKMYKFIWHYVDLNDVIRMIIAITAAYISVFLVFAVGSLINSGFFGACCYTLPRSVFVMSYIFNLGFAVVMRCSVRFFILISSRNRKDISRERLLIIGAGGAGNMLLRETINNREIGKVVGFIDDNPIKDGKRVSDIRVYGDRTKIQEAVEKLDVTQIILAITNLDAENRKQILEICKSTGVKVRTLPTLSQLYSGEVTVSDIKDVEIEDLLGREPIKLENDKVKDFIQGRTVVVTGGGGSIGSEIARQVALNHPKKLILIDSYENNVYDVQQELKRTHGSNLDLSVFIASVRDKERIYDIFDKFRPNIVFHAAAHKHVPLMEDAPSEAIKNNIFGTYHVVRASEKFGVEKFVMISTDKAVNPTNVMGATKRFCEMIIQSRGYFGQSPQNDISHSERSEESSCTFACVRFGNVLGSNGSVVPLFKKQIEEGGPVTVTDKRITRFFMTIPEAVQLVLEAGSMAKQNQVFVLDMGEPVKIIDLAENLIALSGKKPYKDIDIVEIGLRPGEKLYEELLMKSEHLVETENKKIFVEEQGEINPDEIMKNLERLDKAVTQDNLSNKELIELLHEIVPTYIRQ